MNKYYKRHYRSDEDDISLKSNFIEEKTKKEIAKHVEFYFDHKLKMYSQNYVLTKLVQQSDVNPSLSSTYSLANFFWLTLRSQGSFLPS